MPNNQCAAMKRGGGRCLKTAKTGSAYCNNHVRGLIPELACAACGAAFFPAKPTSTTCSPVCRNALNARASAEKRGAAQRGRGEGKTYRKLMGRHEHRVVAERSLGRAIRPDEVVHHINGDPLDNRPENLVVVTRAKHGQIHAAERRIAVQAVDSDD